MRDKSFNPYGEGIPVDVSYVPSVEDDDELIDQEIERARHEFYDAWRSYIKDNGDSLFFE